MRNGGGGVSESNLIKSENSALHPITFAFLAREFYIVNIAVFFASTVFLIYGYFLNSHNIIILGSIFFCYLILRFLIKPRPPKKIILDFLTNTVQVDARFPDKSETISITQLLSVECEVKPCRFPMTEFIFLLKDGTKKIYFFEVEVISNGFFGFPREVSSKKVKELALIINNSIDMQRGKQ